MRKRLLAVLLLIFIVALTGCQSEKKTVKTYKIGVNGTDHEAWDKANEALAKDGIHLEYVEFSDYVKPNEALEEGEIDLNSFQTEIYFKNFCQERGYKDLGVLGYTQVAPMGVYSAKFKKVEDASGHLIIAIPNDVTNGGRAIKFLEKLGYISVDPSAGLTPTVMDITGYLKDVEIVEMVATQIPRSLQDVSFAVINNGVAYDAGLTLTKDALIYENYKDEDMKNYWNVIVTKNENINQEDYKKILAAYQTDDVKKVLEDRFGGQSIPVWN